MSMNAKNVAIVAAIALAAIYAINNFAPAGIANAVNGKK
jgi:hypothetical protein